jgi:hypothetical protein
VLVTTRFVSRDDWFRASVDCFLDADGLRKGRHSPCEVPMLASRNKVGTMANSGVGLDTASHVSRVSNAGP